MRIRKVKITTDDKIYIEYEREDKQGQWDLFTITCAGQPRPKFFKAMEALKKHAGDLLELDLPEDQLKVRGVTYSYSEEKGVMGAVVSFRYKLKKSGTSMALNSPHKPEHEYREDKKKPKPASFLTKGCVEDLVKLKVECQEYLKGERQQQTLL